MRVFSVSGSRVVAPVDALGVSLFLVVPNNACLVIAYQAAALFIPNGCFHLLSLLDTCPVTSYSSRWLSSKESIPTGTGGLGVLSRQAINIGHMLMPLKPVAKLPKSQKNEYDEVLTSEHHGLWIV